MSRIAAVVLLALTVAPACFDNLPSDAGPPEAGPGADTGADGGTVDSGLFNLPDANGFVDYDAGPPATCSHTCDCVQGQACVSGVCRALGAPVYCCDNEGCPGRAICIDDRDQPALCDGPVEVPDSGVPRPDAGPQSVGGECGNNVDCDQTQGLVCWTRQNLSFLWDGYCTVQDCGFGGVCPSGSQCFRFDDAGLITACFKTCFAEPDCRDTAACFLIPDAPFGGACLPDCRDDLVDCFPKDGSAICNPSAGLCVGNSAHLGTAQVGDPCVDSTQCGFGQVCMGEVGWGFTGGMCTHDCAATGVCGIGETCQVLGGFPVCFKDCVGGQCPNRLGASCSMADPNWLVPSCVP